MSAAQTPKGSAIRCPFDIYDAEYEPEAQLFAAFMFDVLERTGVRGILGVILGFLLDLMCKVVVVVFGSRV